MACLVGPRVALDAADCAGGVAARRFALGVAPCERILNGVQRVAERLRRKVEACAGGTRVWGEDRRGALRSQLPGEDHRRPRRPRADPRHRLGIRLALALAVEASHEVVALGEVRPVAECQQIEDVARRSATGDLRRGERPTDGMALGLEQLDGPAGHAHVPGERAHRYPSADGRRRGSGPASSAARRVQSAASITARRVSSSPTFTVRPVHCATILPSRSTRNAAGTALTRYSAHAGPALASIAMG